MINIGNAGRLICSALLLATLAGCGPADTRQSSIAKAKEFREKNNYSAAIIELKNVLQHQPDNAEARYLLAVEYLDARDANAAEIEIRRAIALKFDQWYAAPVLARSLLAQGKVKEALDETDPSRAADARGGPELLQARGLALLFLGRRGEAAQAFSKALELRPEYADALLGQARLAAGDKKLDEAANLIERAIASAPKNADAWLAKAHIAEVNGDLAAASAAIQKVFEFRPNDFPAHQNLATLQITMGNFDGARKEIQQMRRLAPKDPQANYLLALLEYQQKNYGPARAAVIQALKATPDHLPSVLLAGAIEYASGSQTEAQAYLTRVVSRAPASLFARKLLVASYTKTGQVSRALESLQPGLKQAPEDAILLALAGELYVQSNDFAKATEFFEKAAKLDPNNAAVRTVLGGSRIVSGETELGVQDLESAVQLDAGSYRADILLVMSSIQRGDFDRALKAMASLEKKQPENPITYNLKAAISLGKKDVAGAQGHLEHALKLQPLYLPAATNLARLDIADKKPQAARRRFEAMLDKDKNNVPVLIALASFGPQLGASTKERIDWLDRARTAGSRDVQSQLRLAKLYAAVGEARKALEVAKLAETTDPDNPEVLDTLGLLQIGAGDKNQALTTYGKLATLQPNSPAALFRLAEAQVVNKNPTAAIATLKKALALRADFIPAYLGLVKLEVAAGRFPEALKISQQAQKQSTNNPAGFILEGDVLMAQKKFLQAAKAYENGYKVRSSNALVIKLHGAYIQANLPQEATARLARWLKDTPEDAVVREYIAENSARAGKYQDAISQYEWLLLKQPDNPQFLNNLAWAYQQIKDPRALETAERGYKLAPDDAALADTLGWMLVEQGNPKRGREVLQKAAAAAPGSLGIRYHLAQALAKSGDKAQAIYQLELILASGKKFSQEAELLELLRQLKN